MNNLILNYVSPDAVPRLEEFVALIKKWNRKTGLVQENSLDIIWDRHVLDCLQIIPLLKEKDKSILDIGSGAGFPGIVLAIAGYTNVHLCESNSRKAAFLEEVIRQLKLSAIVINKRVEKITGPFDYITSRACSKLDVLLGFMKNVSRETGSVGVFLKGKTVQLELDEAQKNWHFEAEFVPSITAEESKIIVVRNLIPHLKG